MHTGIISKEENYRNYELNGELIPSVTQLLPKQTFFVSAERLAELAEEGTANHAEVEELLKTGVSTSPLTDAVQEFLDVDVSQLGLGKLLYFEQPLVSGKHKFRGKPDMIFENGIVDLKRSIGNKKIHAVQLAGYELLCREAGIYSQDQKCKFFFLVATREGKYGVHRIDKGLSDKMFQMLLNQYYTSKFIEGYFKN